jgi:hypothetical protein
MPKVTHVKHARKAIKESGIKKGDSYYWWKFRFGGIHRSKTQPKPSQLTQSTFLSTMLELQERTEALVSNLRDGKTTCSDAASELSDIASEVRSAGEECQSSLDNMPEGLQQGDTGQMLQTRIDAAETIADDLEGVDTPEEDEEDDDKDDKDEAGADNAAVDEPDADDANQTKRDEFADEIEGVEWSFE